MVETDNVKMLMKLLSEEFGIRTAEDLERELRKQKPINIAVFTTEIGARV